MTIMKIEKNSTFSTLNPYTDFFLKIIYLNILVIGTIGNILIIFIYSYKSSYKKQTTFLAFIVLAIFHLVLLYMNAIDFIKIDFIIDTLTNSKVACSLYNIIYRSFLLLEPWYLSNFFFLIKHKTYFFIFCKGLWSSTIPCDSFMFFIRQKQKN